MLTLYGIANCDSCRKARKYLDALQVSYRFHDLRADGLEADLIRDWLDALGSEALVNRRSTSWRRLTEADRARADGPDLPGLLMQHPTLVKRPLLHGGRTCIAGFDEQGYRQLARTQ